jgi:hypothetical protein
MGYPKKIDHICTVLGVSSIKTKKHETYTPSFLGPFFPGVFRKPKEQTAHGTSHCGQ